MFVNTLRDEPDDALRDRGSEGTLEFEDAYRTHYGGVVSSSWAICKDRQVAEELTQEAFARAYRRWQKLDDGGYAVPWLHRVVMNLTLSHVRRRSRGSVLERVAAVRSTSSTPAPSTNDWLVDLLHRLPKRQREAVFLRYVADLDVAAVADAMGCTPGTVKTHSKRGLDHLRQLVDVDTTATQSVFAPAGQES